MPRLRSKSSRRESAPRRSARPLRPRGLAVSAVPRALAVLFADISGSTSLYEQLGDRAALAAVDSVLEVLRLAVAVRGGRGVKTIGDEGVAVFESPDAAYEAAIDMQTRTPALPEVRGRAPLR